MDIDLAELKTIVSSLIEALNVHLEPLLESDTFKAIGIILDTKSYKFLDFDIIYDEVNVIANHFKPTLIANGCNVAHLKAESEILYDHIVRYL